MVALNHIGASLITEELNEPYKIKDNIKLAVKVDHDFAWETVLSITGKGTESKFATLGAGKGGTAAAGGREGSQVKQISKGMVPAAFDKHGSNTLFAGPHFISPSGIFPFRHHTT